MRPPSYDAGCLASQEMTAAQKKKAKKKAKDKAKKAADVGDGEEAAHAPTKKGAKKVGTA